MKIERGNCRNRRLATTAWQNQGGRVFIINTRKDQRIVRQLWTSGRNRNTISKNLDLSRQEHFNTRQPYCCCCLLFKDGHVLQLWSGTVAVHRRMIHGSMIYDGQMITEDECGPNFLTFVLRLRENPGKKNSSRKLTRPRTEARSAAWEVTMLPLNHSGDYSNFVR